MTTNTESIEMAPLGASTIEATSAPKLAPGLIQNVGETGAPEGTLGTCRDVIYENGRDRTRNVNVNRRNTKPAAASCLSGCTRICNSSKVCHH